MSFTITSTSVFIVITLFVMVYEVNRNIRDPYMDEIFHIPQTQTFCGGKWTEYHPLITTLPGSYILPAILSRIFHLSIFPPLLPIISCSTLYLRLFGVIYLVLCLPILREIIWILHGDSMIAKIQSIAKKRTEQFNNTPKYRKMSKSPTTLTASDFNEMIDRITNHFIVEILFLPIHYFFVFLFYTDIPSTFWLLSCYLIHLKLMQIRNSFKLQAIGIVVGFICILHRQTNVIWIGFYFLLSLYDCFVSVHYGVRSEIDRTQYRLHDLNLWALFQWSWREKFSLIRTLWFDVVLFIGFIIFVVLNGSIVMGDAAHHTLSLHFAQILYLIGLLAIFTMIPTIIHRVIQRGISVMDYVHWIRSRWIPIMVLFVVFLFFRIRCTEVHDFLLSDNRHYSFYFWRYFIGKSWFTPIIVPVSTVAVLWMYEEVSSLGAVSKYWCLVYAVCCGMVLVPTPLFEFRYFIIPIIMFKVQYLCGEGVMIQMVERAVFDGLETNWKRHLGITSSPLAGLVMNVNVIGYEWINLLFYSVINAMTLYVYIRRPFVWVDGSTARFMW